MRSIRGSIALSAIGKYLNIAVQFVSTLVIARLLTPEDIGIFAIGLAVVSFAHAIRNFGTANYLIQAHSIGPELVKSAFTLTLVIGWSAALIMILAGPSVASFYGEAGIRQILWILAANFVLLPFGSISVALLRREMRFGSLLVVEVCSSVVHASVAIGLALLGFRYLSLGYAAVAGTLVTIGLSLCFRPKGLRFGISTVYIRRQTTFGLSVTAATVLEEIFAYIPILASGRLLGMSASGLVSRATGYVDLVRHLVLGAVQPVFLPFLAQQKRDGRSLAEHCVMGTTLITGLMWPILVVLTVLAEPTIELLYGHQWGGAVGPARIIAVAAAISFIAVLVRPTFMATGNAHGYLVATGVGVGIGAPVIILMTAHFGLTGVAIGMVAATAVKTSVAMVAVKPVAGLLLSRLGGGLVKSAMVAASTALGPVLVVRFVEGPTTHVAVAVAAGGLAALPGFLAGVVVTRHPLSGELRRLSTHAANRLNRAFSGAGL